MRVPIGPNQETHWGQQRSAKVCHKVCKMHLQIAVMELMELVQ